jgi:hypothetical protein
MIELDCPRWKESGEDRVPVASKRFHLVRQGSSEGQPKEMVHAYSVSEKTGAGEPRRGGGPEVDQYGGNEEGKRGPDNEVMRFRLSFHPFSEFVLRRVVWPN